MARISDTSSYPLTTPAGSDYLIGTDVNDSDKTKTFSVDSLAAYVLGSGSAYVVPVYTSATAIGQSIISQDAAVGTLITVAGSLTINADANLGTLLSSNEGTLTLDLGRGAGAQTVRIGVDDTDTLEIEATTALQGPIKDSTNTLGAAGESLISDANGFVTWQTTPGTGTVTSVAVDGGTTGFTTIGGPITSSGTITLATSGGSAGQVLNLDPVTPWQNSILTPSLNGTNVVLVTQPSDLPTTLVANTTYLVRGQITIPGGSEITVSSGNAIIGLNRDLDGLIYTGTSRLITVTDQDFTMRNLSLKATDPAGLIISATNINVADPTNNYQRTKVLDFDHLKIQNSTNVWRITGFELIDVNNCLFWYIVDGTTGCEFTSVRHLEISSCEFYNWFEEGNPANLDTYRQISILADAAVGVGNGVVNINSSIIHPEITQDGLYVDPASTTGFGTIASNTFTDTNLTTGVLLDLDYNAQNTFIIQANQGVSNSNATGIMQIANNVIESNNGGGVPGPPYDVVVQDSTFVGGAGPTGGIQFPVATRVLTSSATGSFTYNSKIDASFNVLLTANILVPANGTFVVSMSLRKNAVTLFTITQEHRNSGGVFEPKQVSLPVLGTTTFGDVFDVVVGIDSAQNVVISDLYLTGYQI